MNLLAVVIPHVPAKRTFVNAYLIKNLPDLQSDTFIGYQCDLASVCSPSRYSLHLFTGRDFFPFVFFI